MSATVVPATVPVGNAPLPSSSPASVDLWKFFEERGSKLKESMFRVVTWLVGLASVVLGFAVKEGFAEGSALTQITHPASVFGLGIAGLLILRYTDVVIKDYGEHINRTFHRADAARSGESSPQIIWAAGETAHAEPLPPVCRPLRRVVGLFAASFGVVMIVALIGLAVR